jgi:hypothetical protein
MAKPVTCRVDDFVSIQGKSKNNELLKNIIEKLVPGCFNSFVEHTQFNYLLLVNNVMRTHDDFYRKVFMEKIFPELCSSEIITQMGLYKVIMSKTHKGAIESMVRSIVENDIESLRNLYEHDVVVTFSESRLRGISISISVLIRQYATAEICNQVYESLATLKPSIGKIIGTDNIRIDARGQKPSYYFEPVIGAAEDDGDDDNSNPNWPSTTGNPSGGGRGNNPPGK